ncbi:hypothetical protein DSECCO2_368400 [anaerobic digester metagenome]
MLLSRLPPPPPKRAMKNQLRMIRKASIDMKLAIVRVSISRFFTCDISWASTASSSSRLSVRMIESVTATTAFFGLLPVANAFGTGDAMIPILGLGRPALVARLSTMRCNSGYSSSSTIRVLVLQSTSLSEKKNWRNAIPAATSRRNSKGNPRAARTPRKIR